MSEAESASPPRSWHGPDSSPRERMIPVTIGPDGPFFIQPTLIRLERRDLITLGKTEKDSESTVADLMRALHIYPDDPRDQAQVQTAINAAANVFREEFVGPSGYQTPQYQTKYHSFQIATQDYNRVPIVEQARILVAELPPSLRNIEVEGITRLLVQNDAMTIA